MVRTNLKIWVGCERTVAAKDLRKRRPGKNEETTVKFVLCLSWVWSTGETYVSGVLCLFSTLSVAILSEIGRSSFISGGSMTFSWYSNPKLCKSLTINHVLQKYLHFQRVMVGPLVCRLTFPCPISPGVFSVEMARRVREHTQTLNETSATLGCLHTISSECCVHRFSRVPMMEFKRNFSLSNIAFCRSWISLNLALCEAILREIRGAIQI